MINLKLAANQFLQIYRSQFLYFLTYFQFQKQIIQNTTPKFITFQKIMSRITQQLLRKRSEHNEGCLTTLEQVSLHQQQIIKIQNLDTLCRHLKILYLQNNIIEKMENLNKLKQLEYLNLALNNISKIENIEGCESLKKLDMTVNFIDVFEIHDSVECLSKLPNIKELYLTGNPCEDWKGCKEYVIANVPTLQVYNGETITPSQRIKAVQNLPALQQDLFVQIKLKQVEKKKQQIEQQERKKLQANLTEEEKAQLKTAYTKQMRRQMYMQMAQEKQKKQREKNPQKYTEQKQPEMFRKDGEIRQCNQGKFTYKLKQFEDPDYSFFQLQVPKHLDTSQLVVNINPYWVSVKVKNKLIQLKLHEEIIVSQSKTERSQITGFLLIKMKKLHPHQFIRKNKEDEKKKKKLEEENKKKKQVQEREQRLRLCDEYERKMERQQDEIPDLQ